MLNLMPDQQVHIRTQQDDPTAAWKALETLYVQQKASTGFVAYDEFFTIRKRGLKSPYQPLVLELLMSRPWPGFSSCSQVLSL